MCAISWNYVYSHTLASSRNSGVGNPNMLWRKHMLPFRSSFIHTHLKHTTSKNTPAQRTN